MLEFYVLAQQCASAVHPATLAAVVSVESTSNPFAIGVVGAQLTRQPANQAEAVATAKSLAAVGYNFSLGLGQVNRYNLKKYGLDYSTAFEPCANLRAASRILKECYDRAKAKRISTEAALPAALSCYYSGNFSTGFRRDVENQPSYVQKVLNSAAVIGKSEQLAPMRLTPSLKSERSDNVPLRSVAQIRARPPSGTSFTGAQDSPPDLSVMVYR